MTIFKRHILLAPLIALVLGGCSSVQMSSYKDPGANLTSHATYNWAAEKSSLEYDPKSNDRFVGGYLQLAAESEMSAKGYEKSVKPDVLLGYHVSLDRKVALDTMRKRYEYTYAPNYMLRPGQSAWMTEPVDIQLAMKNYGMGTVVFDVIDARSKRLVWRGTTATRVNESLSRSERDIRLQNAVRLLLSVYPSK